MGVDLRKEQRFWDQFIRRVGAVDLYNNEAKRRRDEAGQKLEEAFGAPMCPADGCGSDARRPKCFFELGPACPRHELLNVWDSLVYHACNYLQLQELVKEAAEAKNE